MDVTLKLFWIDQALPAVIWPWVYPASGRGLVLFDQYPPAGILPMAVGRCFRIHYCPRCAFDAWPLSPDNCGIAPCTRRLPSSFPSLLATRYLLPLTWSECHEKRRFSSQVFIYGSRGPGCYLTLEVV